MKGGSKRQAPPHHKVSTKRYPTAPMARRKVKETLLTLKKVGIRPSKVPIVIDCDANTVRWYVDKTPTLTATRGAGGGFWVTSKMGYFSMRELMALQGINIDTCNVPATLSKRQIGHMFGNAYTLPVLRRIVKMLLKASGLSEA